MLFISDVIITVFHTVQSLFIYVALIQQKAYNLPQPNQSSSTFTN